MFCCDFLSSCVVTVVVFNELEKSSNLLTTNMILFSNNVKCNRFNIVTSGSGDTVIITFLCYGQRYHSGISCY